MTPAELTKRLATVLDRDCPDDEIGRVLRDCLTATQTTRAGAQEPDHKTRLAAAQIVLGQRHGLPVRREETINVNLDADAALGIEARLRHSPAMRDMLRRMLEKVESGPVIEAPEI